MALTPIACFSVLMWTAATVGAQTEATRINVMEDEDVILPCSIEAQTIKAKGFDWKTQDKKEVFLYENGKTYNDGLSGQDQLFRGRVFHFPDQIESGNASIVIRGAKVADSGTYTCRIPSVSAEIRSTIQLTVGAARRPIIMTIDETKDWVLLQCEVDGASPKPRVEWQDSDGKALRSEKLQDSKNGDRFYITLRTNVTKTGNFRCVATQEDKFHQIYTETFVRMNESPTGRIVVAALIPSVLLVAVVVVFIVFIVLLVKGVITLRCDKDQQGLTSTSCNAEQTSDQDSKQPLNS